MAGARHTPLFPAVTFLLWLRHVTDASGKGLPPSLPCALGTCQATRSQLPWSSTFDHLPPSDLRPLPILVEAWFKFQEGAEPSVNSACHGHLPCHLLRSWVYSTLFTGA